ncbi:hypothetical protein [Glycomyces xiaoerkulensis]|uniref:hypothetical protein n=1 Tax=Glycomyces xiaoerkulensis TaxID=2038139 RepID=UPI000C25E76F|nr:hypothetical protein [Glycomyces xiaoerkulensis]
MSTAVESDRNRRPERAGRHVRRLVPVLVAVLLIAVALQFRSESGSDAAWRTALPGEGALDIVDTNDSLTLVRTERGFIAVDNDDGAVAHRFEAEDGERVVDLALARIGFFVVLASESDGTRIGAFTPGHGDGSGWRWSWQRPAPAGTELIAVDGRNGMLWSPSTGVLTELDMWLGNESTVAEDVAEVTTMPDRFELQAWTSPLVVAHRTGSADHWSVSRLELAEPVVDEGAELIPVDGDRPPRAIDEAIYTLDEDRCGLRLFGRGSTAEWTEHEVDWPSPPRSCSPVGWSYGEVLYLTGTAEAGHDALWAVDTAVAQRSVGVGERDSAVAIELDVPQAPADHEALNLRYAAGSDDRAHLIDGLTGETVWEAEAAPGGYTATGFEAALLARESGWWERVVRGRAATAFDLLSVEGDRVGTFYSDRERPSDGLVRNGSATLLLGDTVVRIEPE